MTTANKIWMAIGNLQEMLPFVKKKPTLTQYETIIPKVMSEPSKRTS